MCTGSTQKWSILSLIRFLSLHINLEVYFLAYSLWLAKNTINRFIGQTTDQEILTFLIFFFLLVHWISMLEIWVNGHSNANSFLTNRKMSFYIILWYSFFIILICSYVLDQGFLLYIIFIRNNSLWWGHY